MRAWRYESFGPVAAAARLVDVAMPEPDANALLVRVQFVSINPLDWKLVEGQFRAFAKSRPPAGIGTECAGTVETLGSAVTAPAPGARVIAWINPFARPPGVLQEHVAVASRDVVEVPDDMDLAAACTLPCAGASALQMCRMARVAQGDRVLITGAAGGVGGFAVQVVRALGAHPVAVGRGASQAALNVLQPDARIDYEKQPVSSWGGPFAAILDCANALADADVAILLAEGGHYVNTLPKFPAVVFDSLLNPFRRIKRATLRLNTTAEDLRTLLQWIHEGKLQPVISRRYEFAAAVAALEHSRSGHAHGKLIVAAP